MNVVHLFPWSRAPGVSVRMLLTGLLAICLISALGVLEQTVLVLSLPIPYLGDDMPYLGLFVILIAIMNGVLGSKGQGGGFTPQVADVLFILFLLTLVALETFNSNAAGEPFRRWEIMGFFWIYVFFVVFRSFSYLPDYRNTLVRLSLVSLIALALLQWTVEYLLMKRFGMTVPYLNLSEFLNSNYVAYLCALGFALVLFEHEALIPAWPRLVRYALLAVIAALFYKVAFMENVLGPKLLVMGIVALRLVAWLPNWLLKPKLLAVYAVLAGVALIWLAVDRQGGGEAGFTMQGLMRHEIYFDEWNLYDADVLSGYIRSKTIALNWQQFTDSWLTGVGMSRVEGVRVHHIGMHSSLLFLFFAFGAVGLFAYFLLVGHATLSAFAMHGFAGLALLAIPVAMGLVLTEPEWWMGLIWALVYAPRQVVEEAGRVTAEAGGSDFSQDSGGVRDNEF